ncbi:MAG: OmpP1/FadL family transporter [Paludibacteraceae bacterium]
MKRYSLFLATFIVALSLQAQGVFDVMRYTGTDITGTARYMSMAGAFGALGGDASAIIDNPAGLGIYRMAEATLTADVTATKTQSLWGTDASATLANFAINNAAFVWSFIDREQTKGWVANNIGFTYNRLKNFNRTTLAVDAMAQRSMTDFMANFTAGIEESALLTENNPYDNVNIPYLSELAYQGYLINPDTVNAGQWYSLLEKDEKAQANYKAVETGYVDEFSFAYGANISNVFYWGVSFNLQTISYSLQSLYNENFEKDGEFTLKNTLKTSGAGYNFKFGFIARPVSWLRLGFSVHTPTYYTLSDYHYATMDYTITADTKGNLETPVAKAYYKMQSPLRLQASAAFVIGKSALVSFDYQFTNYKQTKISQDQAQLSVNDAYADVMSDIEEFVSNGHLFKLGAEYRITDGFAVRAGAAYRMPCVSDDAVKNVPLNTTRTDMEYFADKGMCYGSLGLGYRGRKGFGFDLAYAYRLQRESFRPFPDSATEATIKSHAHNAVLTLSYKF